MIVSINKLTRTEIKTHQAHMCLNMHSLNNVYLGYVIVQFNAKQINELKRSYELPMIRKIGLGNDFSRKLLCAQKSSLVIGLI